MPLPDRLRKMAGVHEHLNKDEVTLLFDAADELERTDAKELVTHQANDDGLWFVPQVASEAYLQTALRKLHEVIEGKTSAECAIRALYW